MKEYKSGDILRIDWEDTSSEDCLLEVSAAKKMLPYISTIVGILINEHDSYFVIGMECLHDEVQNNGRPVLVRNTCCIPRRSVIKVERVGTTLSDNGEV